ncbi:nad-dependent deacetylase [Stylonychia lemnae]|uniref:Nad-dependent deacetylase n=1 Tax=Stylonychia lemnae TaxID=5949 RepID=A0A077ZTL5_STYLE|nr:nad-dependent deacetylase [Stylonychia lemnae]|eukprot:CDW73232.1 nad-dependent deacetylase [Stylonychia lemnae]
MENKTRNNSTRKLVNISNPTIHISYKPQTYTPKQAALAMMDKKHIMILTGEDFTADSGLPSLRSYNRHKVCVNGEYLDVEKVMKMQYFTDYTEICWRFLQEYITIHEKCHPNKAHHKFENYDRKISELNPFTSQVYEIHGNIKYMHCTNEDKDCCMNFIRTPSSTEFESEDKRLVQKCKYCDSLMRPHLLFLDEKYNQKYYKAKNAYEFMRDKMDCLILVGCTDLKGFPK